MKEYWSVTFIPISGQPPESASSFGAKVAVIFWHNLKKIKYYNTFKKAYVHIIVGIIKKIFSHQEADLGGWPDTGIKVTLQYSFMYVWM